MKVYSIDKSSSDRNNAASFAYLAVYGRTPPVGFLPAQTFAETDMMESIEKDVHLKNKWVYVLNQIPNIRILSTCEGHGAKNVAHIILKYTGDEELSSVYERLISVEHGLRGTKIIALDTDIGICFVIAIYNWWREDKFNTKWEKWWKKIIPHIHVAVNYS